MGRAERRRQERQKQKSTAVYTLTAEQIEAIKREAIGEAVDTAFVLMMGLPVMVLHDKFDRIWKKEHRLENFIDEVFKLYDSFDKGYITLDDVHQALKDEAGVEIRKTRK